MIKPSLPPEFAHYISSADWAAKNGLPSRRGSKLAAEGRLFVATGERASIFTPAGERNWYYIHPDAQIKPPMTAYGHLKK